MDEQTPQTGAPTPPTHLAFVPFILLAVILGGVYAATLYIFKWTPELASTTSIAEIEKHVEELAKEIIQSAVDVIEPSGRRLFLPRKSEQKKAEVALSEPSVILDFTGPDGSALLNAKSSPDMKSVFGIDVNDGAPPPGSARLSISVAGSAGSKAFSRALITFPEPVTVGEKEAFAFYVKGSGISSLRISAVEKAGENFILWERRDVPVSESWTMVTIPFADCYIWLYDRRTGKYTRSPDFSKPGQISSLRLLVQPRHLQKSAATLWIDSIALR